MDSFDVHNTILDFIKRKKLFRNRKLFEAFLDSAIIKFDYIIDLRINKPDQFKDFAYEFNKKNSRDLN